ncbi:MAG TPA: ABC transporter permease [Bacteroidia bacterium]|nr:ABC transporter permease [Bacteroidia bacterium]
MHGSEQETNKKEKPIPSIGDKKPSRLKQLNVFIQRDVLSKIHNTQYLLINFLEAPLLAFILAYFLKYYKENSPYIFRENINLVAYIFMSVIVALFMGLTVSAEEIIRDRKILKREAFLNLSRSSYLSSKTAVMFLISAIQTLTFVLIGNTIFGVKEMYFDYWLMLFSVSCFANLLGLNISSAFNSAVTIYILIPFLIIPQIILSGVIVKFEKLNPSVTVQNKVPVIGELMASRWAFEALTVNQFKNNRYEQIFFDVDKKMSESTYKNYWLQKMNDKLDSLHLKKFGKSFNDEIVFLQNELEKELKTNQEIKFDNSSEIKLTVFDEAIYQKVKTYLEKLKKYYVSQYNRAMTQKDQITKAILKNKDGGKKLTFLMDNYTNDNLNDFVKNAHENPVEQGKHELIQRYQPVFMDGSYNSFVRTQFFVSRKNVMGNYFSTWQVNLAVIWVMSFILVLTLYFNVLKKTIRKIENSFK